jgi:N-acetylglucosamine-6-phosphate deacetylase
VTDDPSITLQKILCFLPFLPNTDAMSDGEICARHFATNQPVRLRWKNGLITQLEPADPLAENIWLAPGLIDLQVNGYGGIDFQQDNLTVADLLIATRQLRADGCTQFLLTLITDEWSKLTARLKYLRGLRAQSVELQSAISGWHIEGPFLSDVPGFHGAHNPEFMLNPTPAHINELHALTGADPLLITLAPERNGAIEAIALAKSLGMKISLGHTDASAERLSAAVEAGATGFTHLGNGCPTELNRRDNIILRVFDTPGLTAGLIPDQIHVSDPLFRLIHRTLGKNSVYHTTDAMSAAGAPPGRYQLGVMEIEVGADQVVRQPGRPNLAGSALRPIDGIFRAAQMLNRPWQEIWQHSSQIPARLMGFSNALEPGQSANFCALKFTAQNELKELQTVSASSV